MAVLYTNNATTTLAASITNVATSLTVATGTGALFPSITAPDFFFVTLIDASNNIEIVKVTARTSDTFTIVRAQEGTAARAYASADKVELRITAAGLANKLDKDTGGTLSGALALPANGLNVGTGQLVVSGGNVSASGNMGVTGNLTASGNTTLGNASTDTVTINGTAISIPNNINFSGGRVGIGTPNPGAELEVADSSADDDVRINLRANATTISQVGASATITFIDSQGSRPFVVYTNGSDRLRIDGAGNTGVNQPSPASKLDLNGGFASNIVAVAASTIDCTAGNFFTKTAAGALSWTFSSPPASRAFSFILELTNGGTGTQTWPTSVKWPGGTAPTLVASGVDVLGFITDDGGTTWRGIQLMKDSK